MTQFKSLSNLICLSLITSPLINLLDNRSIYAESYQAECMGGAKCTIYISPTIITSPYGSIPPSRVTNWGGGGDSSTSVGTGVATTIFFGPLGLLGFLAKKHDYNIMINGYDQQGKKTSIQFTFKNDKPAKKIIRELQMYTGIGMGQRRTAQEIRNNEKKKKNNIKLGIYKGNEENLYENNKNSLSDKRCWSKYLLENPETKEWEKDNKKLFKDLKNKYENC